jgi:hypothetical protein
MNKRILVGIALLLLGSLSWAGPPGRGARTAGVDSLPWQGRIVFGPWVRVDDAPGTTGHPANHPQMVMDTSHAMYTVWQDDRSNTGRYQIYFSKSTNLGAAWSANRNLSTGLPGNLSHIYPWVAVDTRKDLFVVWQAQQGNQWKVYFTRSTDGGTTWTPADTVQGLAVRNSTTSNINSGPQPKIAVDSKSRSDSTYLYLAWVDDGAGTLRIAFARSVSLGTPFGNQILADHNAGNVNREPDLAVSDSGIVHLVWRWGTGGSNQDPHPWIGHLKSTDHGMSFPTPDVLVLDDTSNVYRGNPTVTVNSRNDNVLVSWEDSRVRSGNSGPDIFFARSTNGGTSFGPNTRANLFSPDPTTENRKPAISIDSGGIAVVAWHDDYNNTRFGIHMAAYNDTTNVFGAPPSSLFNTYTENNGGAFGTNLYPPSLRVVTIDTVPNFFLVWQDLSEDPAGNIYFVRGWVVKEFADLDIYNDADSLHANLMNFGKVAAGPPRQVKSFQLVNTDASHNPDPDGPSLDTLLVNVRPVSVTLTGPNGATFDARVTVPTTLRQGQDQTGTVTLRVPDAQPPGVYLGPIVIQGAGRDTFDVDSDTFNLRVEVGNPLNLGQFKIMPNPFKAKEGHLKIYFYGLPAGCKVRIYDLSGTSVKELQNNLNNGTVAWDPLRDPDVASGIYLYYVTYGQKDIQKGKLSVIK